MWLKEIFRMATIIEINKLTYKILGAAIEVHKVLGPGLLESVYQRCLKKEFHLRKLRYESEFLVPVNYKGESLEADLRCDFLVENEIVVELKATDAIAPVYEAQLLTYMKLLRKPKGILINFNCSNLFNEGQRTYVNDYFRTLREQ
jgi:GxxExxY protein